MALVTVEQRLAPSVPAGVTLPPNFFKLREREAVVLLGNQNDRFTDYANALSKLGMYGERPTKEVKQAMLGRLRNNMIEGQHYLKPPGASLLTGKGITLLVPGKNQFLQAGVGDGDAWQQDHVGFRDWMLSNHLQILNAFTNTMPDQQYITNRANNVVQFNQNVQGIAQNNPKQVARRGDQELFKAMAHPDELTLKRRADGSIETVGLVVKSQARRIVQAAGGDPEDPATLQRVQKKGTISSQLTGPAQAQELFLRSMAQVQNALNPGDYSACVKRVRDEFINSQALLHKDSNGDVRSAEEQRLIAFNPAYVHSGGTRRNGPELLEPTRAATPVAPALAAPALPPPAAALPVPLVQAP